MPRNTYTIEERARFVEKLHRGMLVTGKLTLNEYAREIGTEPRTLRIWCRRYPEFVARMRDKNSPFGKRPIPEKERRRRRQMKVAATARRLFEMGFSIAETCEHLQISRWTLMDLLQNEYIEQIRRRAKVRRPYVYKKNIRQYQPRYFAAKELYRKLESIETPPAVQEIYDRLKAEYSTTTLHQRLLMQDVARHTYVCDVALEQVDRIELHHMAGFVGTEEHLYAWVKAYHQSAEKMRLSLKLLGVKLGERKKARKITRPRAGKVRISQ